MHIGLYTFEEYTRVVENFHGYTAPGVFIGGVMVELARRRIPEGVLFDAICETPKCLPDAIQLLTPCTIGNSWLKVINLGRYALSLYDKHEGSGVRIALDPHKLERYQEIKVWLFKLKPKREQDTKLLLGQIEQAGADIYEIKPIQVQDRYLQRKSRGSIVECPMCGEAYPAKDGAICRGCQGEAPYLIEGVPSSDTFFDLPPLQAVSLQQAVGKIALHDMTQIIPGQSKGPVIRHGQEITAGDLCRLHQMGRENIYVQQEECLKFEWVHEDEAALAFAKAMAGEGVTFKEPAREGKINLIAERDGLFMVDEERLEQFNLAPGVMCACRKGHTVVETAKTLAGTRALPLFLSRQHFVKAMAILNDTPLFRVVPLLRARVGILVTGSEVFQGLIEDKFIPVIRAKVEKLGSEVVQANIAPDDRFAIRQGIEELLAAGVDIIVTTAGLSVDPDDVTRQSLLDAGASDVLYGAPILPGAMTLLAHIGNVQVIGVPACALYHKTTSFDLLFPRLLAGLCITRRDLAKLGHGALCLECKSCTFPKCPFGK